MRYDPNWPVGIYLQGDFSRGYRNLRGNVTATVPTNRLRCAVHDKHLSVKVRLTTTTLYTTECCWQSIDSWLVPRLTVLATAAIGNRLAFKVPHSIIILSFAVNKDDNYCCLFFLNTSITALCFTTYSWVVKSALKTSKGVFIATQLNWTQLTQLNSVQPSQSCFCLWRHDLQTESTVVHAVELSSVVSL